MCTDGTVTYQVQLSIMHATPVQAMLGNARPSPRLADPFFLRRIVEIVFCAEEVFSRPVDGWPTSYFRMEEAITRRC